MPRSIGRDEVQRLVDEDWLAFDLSYEGYANLAGPVASREVPTCSFRDRLGDVRQLLEASRLGMLVALDEPDHAHR